MYGVCSPTSLAEIVGSGFSERERGVGEERERLCLQGVEEKVRTGPQHPPVCVPVLRSYSCPLHTNAFKSLSTYNRKLDIII